MYSIVISIIIGAGIGCILNFTAASSTIWSIVFGIIAIIVSGIIIGIVVRRHVLRIMGNMQQDMAEGQKKLQARVEILQRKPTGDPKRIVAEFEKAQNALVLNALESTKKLDPYKNWIPLFTRQINTTRMQLYYQMQNFKKVDELMPKTMAFDQMTASMKIARMYVNGADIADVVKVFNKTSVRLKYNQSVILCSLMAWLYVQKNMTAEAHAVLVKACEKNENPVLRQNLDKLANGRVAKFSNAGLGDEWYTLFLEQPKIQIRRQQARMDGRPF